VFIFKKYHARIPLHLPANVEVGACKKYMHVDISRHEKELQPPNLQHTSQYFDIGYKILKTGIKNKPAEEF
jgi:hypothetical protein